MEKDLLNQIKQDKLFDYLKENTNYIKELNRNPEYINKMKDEMKEKYKLRFEDKVDDLNNKINLVKAFIDALK